jgi:hypothetical protein
LLKVTTKNNGKTTKGLVRVAQLGMRLEKDNNVSMRKAPLLKLNSVKKA